MDALGILLGCFIVTIVWALAGCVTCRRKPTEDEIQQQYFEKFRKRHMLQGETVLNNRVDIIRKPSISDNRVNNIHAKMGIDEEIPAATNFDRKIITVSVTSSAVDHTYEDIPSLNHQTTQGASEGRDHSFFDESFQTVVEVSSASYMSNPAGSRPMHYLSVPDDKLASYLSLRPESSRTCLYPSSSLETVQRSGGEVNSAFSETSLVTEDHERVNNEPNNDTYLVPKCGPIIKITQPSIRKPGLAVSFEDVIDNLGMDTIAACSSNNSKFIAKKANDSHTVSMDNISDARIQNDEMRFRNLQKLLMEGRSHHSENRRQSYDSSQTLYEKLKESRIDNNPYKSLTSLVLPSIKSSKPRKSTDSSKHSDHTYESITAELSHEMLRGDMNDMDYDTSGSYPEPFESPCFTEGRRRQSRSSEGLNDLNKSPDHTYESLNSNHCTASPSTPDLSVVIIGRRKTCLYGSIRSSKNGNDNVSQNCNLQTFNFDSEIKKLNNENVDRYSPFPSCKKLAIKSSFKSMPSSRFPELDTVSGSITPYRIPDCLGTMGQSCRRFSVENADMHTPEITVNSTPTVFFSPKKQYYQPIAPGINEGKKQPFISPLCTYQTLKARLNLKSKDLNGNTPNRRSSLPSISDQLDTEIKDHCDMNQFSSSTPFIVM